MNSSVAWGILNLPGKNEPFDVTFTPKWCLEILERMKSYLLKVSNDSWNYRTFRGHIFGINMFSFIDTNVTINDATDSQAANNKPANDETSMPITANIQVRVKLHFSIANNVVQA